MVKVDFICIILITLRAPYLINIKVFFVCSCILIKCTHTSVGNLISFQRRNQMPWTFRFTMLTLLEDNPYYKVTLILGYHAYHGVWWIQIITSIKERHHNKIMWLSFITRKTDKNIYKRLKEKQPDGNNMHDMKSCNCKGSLKKFRTTKKKKNFEAREKKFQTHFFLFSH